MKPLVPWSCSAAAGLLSLALSAPCWALAVRAENLISDDPLAHPAQLTDAGLVNAWGISASPASPFWVSSNGTGTAVLYRVDPVTQVPTKQALTVVMPGAGNITGQVFNPGTGFNGDRFLFVSEDGTISGWRGALGTTAEVLQTATAGNVYKGSAFATFGGNSYLYAANFETGTIDVLKGTAAAPNLSGSFTDPNLPAGFAPFNVQNLGGRLYVTYAKQDPNSNDELAGAGLGFVDAFDLNGNLIARIAGGGPLNAPWGLAIAPSSFGALADALLVGNFGDGTINAYDLATDALLGPLLGESGQALVIDGLWGLAVGNGGGAGSASALYFSAGPDGEKHGLFGVLTVVPEPPSGLLVAAALAAGTVARRRRRAA